jgi:hypothetical protein
MTRQYVAGGRAGCVQLQKTRENGMRVGVYNNRQAGLDEDGGAWSTVCETHGTCVAHDTLKHALEWAPVPARWCEACG